jgi:hypothetical protein
MYPIPGRETPIAPEAGAACHPGGTVPHRRGKGALSGPRTANAGVEPDLRRTPSPPSGRQQGKSHHSRLDHVRDREVTPRRRPSGSTDSTLPAISRSAAKCVLPPRHHSRECPAFEAVPVGRVPFTETGHSRIRLDRSLGRNITSMVVCALRCALCVVSPALCPPALCPPALCPPALCPPALCPPALCPPALCPPRRRV